MDDDRERGWLERIWAALDGDPDLIDRVDVSGPPGLLPAVFDVSALATTAVAAAALAVAELGARRFWTGVPEVRVDRFAAVDAYGWSGPWAGRRGFDSLVRFSCAIASAAGAGAGSGDGRPVPLPAQALGVSGHWSVPPGPLGRDDPIFQV